MKETTITTEKKKHGSLFSGIGGFDLAAEWMGWENIFHCEWNKFGQKVLKHHFPKSISYEDITKTDFSIHRGNIDILTGGFPCQPYSVAGKRKGKADERHLWPEMLRAIREIQPGFVVGENVSGIVNWSGGLVFDEVQTDLENEGYEVLPVILPACAVNAPHRRDRVWFIAYSNGRRNNTAERTESGFRQQQDKEQQRNRGTMQINRPCDESFVAESETTKNTKRNGCLLGESNQEGAEIWERRNISAGSGERIYISEGNATNARLLRQEKCEKQTAGIEQCNKRDAMHTNGTSKQREHIGQTREGKFNGPDSRDGFVNFQNFPTQPPICGGDDGLPTELDGITFPKWRNESIKAYGNAIVPQIAFEIFKAIEQINYTK